MSDLTDTDNKKRVIVNITYYAVIILLAFLAVRYALGVCLPIVAAFFIATMLQRPKNFIVKKTFIKKGFASVISLFALLFIVAFFVVLIGVRAVEEIRGFIDYIILQIQNFDVFLTNIENAVISFVGNLPGFLSETLSESVGTIFTQLREYIAGQNTELTDSIAGSLGNSFNFSWITAPLSGVISTAKQIPSIIISIIVCLVASCFMAADYEEIMGFIKRQFPREKRKDLSRAKNLLKTTLSKMAKAYALIMTVTFTEMFLGLTLLRMLGIFSSSFTVIIAVVTAIVDIIPVLGTGTILLPWAVYSLIVGKYPLAIGLLVIYAVITVIRQIVEPKLVAGQLGLSPVVTVSALYLGLKIFGVFGMIIAPILLTMLKVLNDEGIIRIWKSSRQEAEETAQLNKASEAKTEQKTE